MGITYSTLNHEIIILILTHVDHPALYQCALLSRYFYTTTRPLLWRSIYLSQAQANAFLYPVIITHRRLGYLIKHLNLTDFEFTDDLLLLLMRQTPLIVSVVLDNGAQITDRSMQYVPYYWRWLESIQLTGSTMTHFGVLNHIRHLQLWNCSRLDWMTFTVPFQAETLIIDMHDPIALDLSGLAQLHELRVYGGLGTASQGWPPQLTLVSLDECFNWMDHDVVLLLLSCPHLTSLTLQDGILTDTFLALVVMYLPHLTHLDVSYNDQLTANGVRAFVNRAHALRLITLAYCNLPISEFPEASIHCGSSVRTRTNTVVRLDHLDLQAILRMRRSQFLIE